MPLSKHFDRHGPRLMGAVDIHAATSMVLETCVSRYGALATANRAALRWAMARERPKRVCPRVKRHVRAGRAAVFVTESKIEGVCLWHVRSGRIYCDWLFVRPDAQGRGLGAVLIGALYDIAKRWHRLLELDCLKHNTASLSWYGRHGFRIIRPAPRRRWGRATLQCTLLRGDDTAGTLGT
jgi:GNAT superfamily N-acetyltransferase